MRTLMLMMSLMILVHAMTASAFAQADQDATTFYQETKHLFTEGAPATINDFVSSLSEQPDQECSNPIAPGVSEISYSGYGIYHLMISLPEGHYDGVVMSNKGFDQDNYMRDLSPSELKSYLTRLPQQSWTATPAGVRVIGSGQKMLWKKNHGFLIVRVEPLSQTPSAETTYEICRDHREEETPPPPQTYYPDPNPPASSSVPPICWTQQMPDGQVIGGCS